MSGTAAPQPLRPTDPREIAGYALRGRLGEGGQGVVYLGVSQEGQQAAVKLLHAHILHDGEARRYFHRELAALQRVAPFCTARVLDADPDADPPYVVSEYVEGPSLQQAVRERGVLTGTALDRLAVATATALGAVHSAGVVHRDFKPANVLLGADGPRVIDFGIARPFDATAATTSGAVGTPAYMSPEQLAGDPVGPPLDMFAWACTIAFAANGAPPFGHEPLPAVINRILNAEPDLGRLSGRLRAYVAACLAKDPARRPTAQQVLLGLMDDRPGAGHPLPSLQDGAPAGPAEARGGSGAASVPPGRADGRTGSGAGGYVPSGLRDLPPPDPRSRWSTVPPPAPSSPTPVTRTRRGRSGLVIGAAVVAGLATASTVTIIALNGPGRATPTPSPVSATSPGTPATPSASATGTEIVHTPRLGLEVWQGGKAVPLALTDTEGPVTTATLAAAPLELRFPKLAKDRALQICAWTDDSVFSIKDGGKTDDQPCFAPGTGIADYERGSGTLYLNREGHNYLIGGRVEHLSGTQDKVFFSSVFKDGSSTPLSRQQGDLYLAAFVDLNGDGRFKRAGEGEYEYLVLHFADPAAGPTG
ncbi:protein kinase [Nonomuraea pusilla]|uniref:serine/threonine-protein kinase n=1 Tax=Nonomuraea pusilla TaxID=46177 RepID=UPI00332BEADF